MRRILIAVALLCTLAWASGPARTVVTDMLSNPDGSPAYGTITVTNPSTFTSADGWVVPQGTVATAVIVNGTFSISLIPNAGSLPSGTSYQATYKLGTGTFTEAWIIPSSGTAVNLSAVRTLSAPTPGLIVSFSQLAPPANCTNLFPQWTGTQWTCSSSSGGGMANPMTVLGDLIFGSSSGSPTRLAGNTSSNREFLSQTGDGTNSAAPAWAAIAAADLPPNISSSTSGNAATATALKTAPAQCTAGQYATGVGADGTANCSQIGYGQLSGAPTLRYQLIQAAGTALAQEATLNLTGSGISCTDDPGNGRTTCTVTSNPGTVTSVGLALPSIFAVSGSPITGNGTLTASLAAQSANQIFAGPASGTAAAPGFRSLVAADLPANISSSTSGNAATATALAAVPAQCAAGQYATGVAASGAANCAQVTFSQVAGTATAAQLPAMAGDAGSGGSGGIVPAPAAGDAAAGKFLKADGTWSAPAGGSSGIFKCTAAPAADAVTASGDFAASCTIPAGTMKPGSVISIQAYGIQSVVAGHSSGFVPTITPAGGSETDLGNEWQIYWNSASTSLPWQSVAHGVVATAGASGSVVIYGKNTELNNPAANQTNYVSWPIYNAAALALNTTVDNVIKVNVSLGSGDTYKLLALIVTVNP